MTPATQLPPDLVQQHDAIWRDLQAALAAGDVAAVNACGRDMRALVPALKAEFRALVDGQWIGKEATAEEIARYDELQRVLSLYWGRP
jgi:hypothetical protein